MPYANVLFFLRNTSLSSSAIHPFETATPSTGGLRVRVRPASAHCSANEGSTFSISSSKIGGPRRQRPSSAHSEIQGSKSRTDNSLENNGIQNESESFTSAADGQDGGHDQQHVRTVVKGKLQRGDQARTKSSGGGREMSSASLQETQTSNHESTSSIWVPPRRRIKVSVCVDVKILRVPWFKHNMRHPGSIIKVSTWVEC